MTSCHFPLTSASSCCSPRESPCHRRPPRFLAPRDFILATTNGTMRRAHAWANDRAESPGWADKGSLPCIVPRITSFCLSTCLPPPLSFHSIDGATPLHENISIRPARVTGLIPTVHSKASRAALRRKHSSHGRWGLRFPSSSNVFPGVTSVNGNVNDQGQEENGEQRSSCRPPLGQ